MALPAHHNAAPTRDALLDEVIEGLRSKPKRLPCKLFYDATGSALFERICRLPEYYPTRTELGILQRNRAEMAAALGPDCLLIEFGAGSGLKTRLLAEALERPVALVLIDISPAALDAARVEFDSQLPHLALQTVIADYSAGDPLLPAPPRPPRNRAVYFPGSTVGNLEHEEAVAFLRRCRRLVGTGGKLLLGTDLDKDPAVIEAAYNDRSGTTAAFNRNLLAHCNHRLGADFDPEAFDHQAPYDGQQRRIEMQLVARSDQTVTVAGEPFTIAAGESIRTEYSHKYRRSDLDRLAARAGFVRDQTWTDDRQWFACTCFSADRAPHR